MNALFCQLKTRLQEREHLQAAASLLHWDQATYMPCAGELARAGQIATLERIAHEKLTDPALGRILDALCADEASFACDSDEACLIRVTRRDYEKAVRVPAPFVSELNNHIAASYMAWTRARPENNFNAMIPYLEKTIDFSRRWAGFFAPYEHMADPLIDSSDEGMTVSQIQPLFAGLRKQLVPLLRSVLQSSSPDHSCLRQTFPESLQLQFGREVAERFGYDWNRGRQDKTAHPFMTKISRDDVRILTRVKENDLREALFSTLHEAGHGLYEQGIKESLSDTPLDCGASASLHESQSRLWENIVGKSRLFWAFFYPRLKTIFPAQLKTVSLDTFYRAMNKVERSLIRTDADEVTYNLHVLIRFDLELDLLTGKLAPRDLPEAWRERYRLDMGMVPSDHRDGALQDVHWYSDLIGGNFQCYTLGNLMSAQLYEAAIHDDPEIPAQMGKGEFGRLRGWLTDRIYQHGRKYSADDLVTRATGKPLSIDPFLNYLSEKYRAIY